MLIKLYSRGKQNFKIVMFEQYLQAYSNKVYPKW